eukprot:jgi/Botrbrau1/14454/Bobra.0014s0098.1
MSLSLAVVRPRMSCVIDARVEDAWAAVRDWARLSWIPQVDGRRVTASLVSGGAGTDIGCIRRVKIGEQQIHEKLVAIDDETRTMKWRLISYPDTSNPFTASFVNYVSTMRLESITVGCTTFIDWSGEFFTEHDHAQGMKDIFERWYQTAAKSLEHMLQNQGPSSGLAGQHSGPVQYPFQPHVMVPSVPTSHVVYCQPMHYQQPNSVYLRAVEEHSAVLRGLSGGSMCDESVTFPFARLQESVALQQQLSMGSSNGHHEM